MTAQEIADRFFLDAQAVRLIDRFVAQIESGSADLAYFADAGRGLGGESWATRRIAILQLEHLVWRLAPEELGQLPELLSETPDNPEAFVKILRRRAGRLARIHDDLITGGFTEDWWADFFHVAQQECRLTAARWLLRADEVVSEIRARVLTTRGTADQAPAIVASHSWTGGEDPALPAQETELVNALTTGDAVYWVTPRVGSELNALIEYPVNSASMVIKPPGSDLEIQIKRSGLRGPRAFDVVFERGGEEIPSSHRLQGGSLGWLARREARASGRFAGIYKAVHGEDCPLNETVSISSVVEVPSERGPAHIIDYLTNGEAFGDGFERMRSAMRRTTAGFPNDTGVKTPGYEGPRGETLQFIAQCVPQQAIQIHTTSYRLEHVADWLTEKGMRRYLAAAGRTYAFADARRFGCDVMDEVLAGFMPARRLPEDYDEFVKACFDVPENRARADGCYLSLLEQTGKVWGTLLGVRGYTDGESFVIRNSGVRSVWNGSGWEVIMRFMDHDDLVIAGPDSRHFRPSRALLGMSWDELHIAGGNIDGMPVRGIAGALRQIYRVSDETAVEGMARLRASAKSGYRKTRLALRENAELGKMFSESFVEGIDDLDIIAARFQEAEDKRLWQTETRRFLESKGYPSDVVDEYVRSVPGREQFLRKMGFLLAPQR